MRQKAVGFGRKSSMMADRNPGGAGLQDLRDADLRNFVEIVSEATGRSFVLDPGVRGTVTVLAPDQMSPQDLFEVFLSVLELNRLTLIEGAGADRIVPMNVARELSSGGSAGLPSGFETRVIPVKEVIEVVRPLLPAEAVIFEMSVEGLSDLSVQFGAVLNNALVGGAQFDLPGRSSLTNLISSVSNGGGATLGSG